jgi:flagellar capping protein FliD
MSLLAFLPAIAAPKRNDARLEARIRELDDRIRDLEARAARNDYPQMAAQQARALAQFQQMQANLQQVYNCVPARGDLLRR